MRLTPWRKHAELSTDPGTGSLRTFRDQMDRLFDSFFGGWPSTGSVLPDAAGQWSPDLDVSETDKEYVVRAELPGLNPEDIDVRVTGNVLTLSGEKREDVEDKKEGYYRSERRFGSFFRSLDLPSGTKPADVSAEFDKGVLVLKVPKDGTAAARKIEIKGAAPKEIEVKKPKL